jgi:proteasome lid subunit RPN8/RPN11
MTDHCLLLRHLHLAELVSEMALLAPAEACGFLGVDRNHRSAEVLPVENISPSTTRFVMSRESQHAQLRRLSTLGLWPIVYHTHRRGGALPSPSDRRSLHRLQVPLLILAAPDGDLELGCFMPVDGPDDQLRFTPMSVILERPNVLTPAMTDLSQCQVRVMRNRVDS